MEKMYNKVVIDGKIGLSGAVMPVFGEVPLLAHIAHSTNPGEAGWALTAREFLEDPDKIRELPGVIISRAIDRYTLVAKLSGIPEETLLNGVVYLGRIN